MGGNWDLPCLHFISWLIGSLIVGGAGRGFRAFVRWLRPGLEALDCGRWTVDSGGLDCESLTHPSDSQTTLSTQLRQADFGKQWTKTLRLWKIQMEVQ